jgi:hypothetical protein
MQWFGSNDFDIALAGDAVTALTGTLTGAKLHLTKDALAIDRNTTLADLAAIEADYNTYAAASITWLAVSIADDGSVELVGTVPEFRPTDALAPNDIHAAYITDSGATVKYFAAAFDDGPLPMNQTTDSIIVTLRFRPETEMLGVVVS